MPGRDVVALIAELSAPAEAGAHAGVNRYLHDLWRRRPDLQAAYPDLDGIGAEGLVRWAYTSGRYECPIPDAVMPPAPDGWEPPAAPPPPAGAGVNVCGYLRGSLGLGEAARLVIRGLDAAQVPVLPVDAGVRDPLRDGAALTTVPPSAAAFPLTVACANPDVLAQLRDPRRGAASLLPPGGTVAYMWWEVEDALPLEWQIMDYGWLGEVWVGTEHVRRCLEPHLRVPVVNVGLPVDPEPLFPRSRHELGLPEGQLFLTVFDYASDLRRKNPLGVIQAFSAAFAPGEGPSLVIKCVNPEADPHAHRLLGQAAEGHPDVHVMEGLLRDDVFDALLAACDCYVSLHRAEGFGLPLANAMHRGKPVVATAHSGNLDFMTAENSYLVPATPRRVGAASRYPAEGLWGEPDIPAAVEALRAVAGDPVAAAARGGRAATDIRLSHSPRAVGARMAERLAGLTPAAAPASTAALRELIAAGPPAPSPGTGRLRRRARETLLRTLRPHTIHQRRVDAELAAALERVESGALAAARAHAATLAEFRRQRRERVVPVLGVTDGRAPAAGNGSGHASPAPAPAAP